MRRRLPPLNGLRAFEAAARHLSFTKAAEELHVTSAAVSQQVKALEEYFDLRLFRRLTRALRLTDAAQAALPLLQEGLDKLAEVDRVLRNRQDDRVLTVSVAPSFGAKWLVPRLDRFHSRYPDYDIRLDATDRRTEFSDDNVDIALRFGRGTYAGLRSECLLAEFTLPVCSPALTRGKHPLRSPEDLRHHTLLHVQWGTDSEAAPTWRMWLRAAGISDKDMDTGRGPIFSRDDLAVQAAMAGQGVALVANALVLDDLAQGRLVQPFPAAVNQATRFSYYLVYPERYLQRPKVAAFRDWVMAEAGPGAGTA